MKQTGQIWRDAQGVIVPERYITTEQKAFERIGQKMAAEAQLLEVKINASRAKLLELENQAYAIAGSPEGKRFTFFTFDREFKIEFDIKEQWVRVYKATRGNPKAKDYETIVRDLNHNIKPAMVSAAGQKHSDVMVDDVNKLFGVPQPQLPLGGMDTESIDETPEDVDAMIKAEIGIDAEEEGGMFAAEIGVGENGEVEARELIADGDELEK